MIIAETIPCDLWVWNCSAQFSSPMKHTVVIWNACLHAQSSTYWLNVYQTIIININLSFGRKRIIIFGRASYG